MRIAAAVLAVAGALALPASASAGVYQIQTGIVDVTLKTFDDAQAPGCSDDGTTYNVDLSPLLTTSITVC